MSFSPGLCAPGARPESTSDSCTCHYTGTTIDGSVFDSSVQRGKPATFSPGGVIGGWTEALMLMRPGDKCVWEPLWLAQPMPVLLPSNLLLPLQVGVDYPIETWLWRQRQRCKNPRCGTAEESFSHIVPPPTYAGYVRMAKLLNGINSLA